MTSHSAVFVYNYGDFRGNPEELMSNYFDAIDLEEKAGAAPTIQQGPEGTALVFQFTDGRVMIMARHGSDNCIRGATAYVARSNPRISA